jgi:membrane protein DedA with SNARE-associated domain
MRFVYGVRVAGPIIVGSSGLSPKRFAFWNVISAAIWSVISCSAGYLLGETIHWALKNTEYIILSFTGAVVAIILIFKLYQLFMKRFQ